MKPVLTVVRADLEACSRRNNIRLVGIPETTDTGKIENFVEELLKDIYGAELSPVFIVEQEKDAIVRGARECGQISYEGNNISFYPDFTPACTGGVS